MGLFDAVKAFVTNPQNIQKAKELATDENVNAAAEKLKQLAPKQAGLIDGAAEKAKDWGGPENDGAAPSEIAESGNAGEADTPGSSNESNAAGPTDTGNGDAPKSAEGSNEGTGGSDQNDGAVGNERKGDAGN